MKRSAPRLDRANQHLWLTAIAVLAVLLQVLLGGPGGPGHALAAPAVHHAGMAHPSPGHDHGGTAAADCNLCTLYCVSAAGAAASPAVVAASGGVLTLRRRL